MTDRLYRSPFDRVIAGVAGGMAVWLNLDPSLVRVAWVLLALFSGGAFVIIYIVMMIVVPLAPPGWVPRARTAGPPGGTWGPPPGPGGTWGPAPGPGGPPAQDGPTGEPGHWTSPPPGWAPGSPDWASPRAAGNAGLVLGVVLVLLGAWFLVDRYVHVDWQLVWPVAVIIVGGVLIAAALRRGRGQGS